jgi:hypothetical protein
MAITRFRIAPGFGKVFGDTATVPGLAYAKFRRIDYLYKPTDQPAAIYPQRVIEIKYVPPGAPPAEAATLDFYRKPQSEWTIAMVHRIDGLPPVDVQHIYNATLMECTMLIEDNDVTSQVVLFMLNAEEMGKILSKEKPTP